MTDLASSDSSARVIDVDITAAARPWWSARFAEYFMVVFGAYQVSAGVVELIESALASGWEPYLVLFLPIRIGVGALNLWVGWSRIGIVDVRYHRLTIFALFLLILWNFFTITLVIYIWDFLTLKVVIDNPSAQDVLRFQERTRAIAEHFVGSIWAGLTVLGAIIGIIGLFRIGRSRIPDIGMTFKEFIAQSRHLQHAYQLKTRLRARNRTEGIGWWLLGFMFLFPSQFSFPTRFILLVNLTTFLGWYLIMHSRVYFQPDFQQLTAEDGRKPVIFLRSFADDEKTKVRWLSRGVVSLSLEARLATYFHNFGPFIAIASPTARERALPVHIGAAMVHLKDDEWQSTVRDWMQRARVVVMFPGLTPAVNWELNEVVTSGQIEKLLLIFPPVREATWYDELKVKVGRLDQIKKVFASTRWTEPLDRVASPESIRVITFAASGDVTVIRSSAGNRDSYHMAAMVAHFLQLRNLL